MIMVHDVSKIPVLGRALCSRSSMFSHVHLNCVERQNSVYRPLIIFASRNCSIVELQPFDRMDGVHSRQYIIYNLNIFLNFRNIIINKLHLIFLDLVPCLMYQIFNLEHVEAGVQTSSI